MKLIDILEDVVNLADVRKRKEVDSLSKEFDQYEQLETAAGEAFNELHAWAEKQMENIKVPGFTSYDDIAGYILADVGMPANPWPKVWRDWFTHLPKEDQDRVRMMSHHSPRIIKVLTNIKNKFDQFDAEWGKEFDKLPNAKARARVFDSTHAVKSDLAISLRGFARLANLDEMLTV